MKFAFQPYLFSVLAVAKDSVMHGGDNDDNHGSAGMTPGNSSDLHGGKGIWKWSKKVNISRDSVMERRNRSHHGSMGIIHGNNSDVHVPKGIRNWSKQVNITVHHGIKGNRRSTKHHKREKKGGKRGHHEVSK